MVIHVTQVMYCLIWMRKKRSLHSLFNFIVKFAIANCFLRTSPGITIRIVKNLRGYMVIVILVTMKNNKLMVTITTYPQVVIIICNRKHFFSGIGSMAMGNSEGLITLQMK